MAYFLKQHYCRLTSLHQVHDQSPGTVFIDKWPETIDMTSLKNPILKGWKNYRNSGENADSNLQVTHRQSANQPSEVTSLLISSENECVLLASVTKVQNAHNLSQNIIKTFTQEQTAMKQQQRLMMQEWSCSLTNNLARLLSHTNLAISSITERHMNSVRALSELMKSYSQLTERYSREGSIPDLETVIIMNPYIQDLNPRVTKPTVSPSSPR